MRWNNVKGENLKEVTNIKNQLSKVKTIYSVEYNNANKNKSRRNDIAFVYKSSQQL